MGKTRSLSLVVVGLFLCFAARPGWAAPVDNPGFFFWNGAGGELDFHAGSITQALPSSGGSWDTDINGSGTITTNAMSIAPVTVGSYTVQVLVTAGSTTGSVNAATNALSLSLTMRIRITGGGVGSSCVTTSFTGATISPTNYTYSVGPSTGDGYIYTGWLSVPAFAATDCASQGTSLNSTFGFGASGQGVKLVRVHYTVAGGPFGT